MNKIKKELLNFFWFIVMSIAMIFVMIVIVLLANAFCNWVIGATI
jgi:hypothetical protein